jgi:signal transduction histidine kinase
MSEKEAVDILLVDDQPARLLTYEAILSPLGHRLVTAGSGVEALARIMEREFAVILLDVSMPEMDGFETAQMIHQHPRFESMPIIFVTGVHVSELDRLKGYELGAIDYVYVPVVPEILRSKVAVLVELHCQRQELKRLNESLTEANLRLDTANRRLKQEKASELAELNKQLQAKNRELVEADQRKNDFLAILGHELRNPLAPISNAIEILQRIGPQEPRMSQMRELIDRQVRHMARLVDDLLDVSRITQDKINLKSERLDLCTLVKRAVETQMPAIRARGHEIVVKVPCEPLNASGDAVRLAQVLGNLVNNAAKYTPDGGRIEVSLAGEDGCARISVRDNGIGIEVGYLKHVFELFGQVRNPRPHSHDGLGIGLALVQRLVEMHEGRVEVLSGGPGKGSEFVIHLPLLQDGSAEAAVCAPEQSTGSAWAGRRVLVVDDAEDCRDSLALLLQMAGSEVRTAHDGLDALDAAAGFGPEIILMDIRMPKMDGYEAAKRLRAAPGGDGLILVALTGWGQPEHLEKSRLAGFDAHLTKPVEAEKLLYVLANLNPRKQASEGVAASA